MNKKATGENIGLGLLYATYCISFVFSTHYDTVYPGFHFPYKLQEYKFIYFDNDGTSLGFWSFVVIFVAISILFWSQFKNPTNKKQIAIRLAIPLAQFNQFYYFPWLVNRAITSWFYFLPALLTVIVEVMIYIGRRMDRKGQYVSRPSSPTGIFGMDAPTRIRNLKKLHDDGLITNEEYEKKKAELLNAL
jgi:hypothetical protein